MLSSAFWSPMHNFYLTLLLLCLSLPFGSHAQTNTNDTLYRYPAHDEIIADFYQRIGAGARLYNGPELAGYGNEVSGNPFYLDDIKGSNGSVSYDGFVYNNVPLMYELKQDVLATYSGNNLSSMALHTDRVKWFKLDGRTFINLNPDTLTDKTELKAGFYNLLYDGKSRLLCKFAKTLERKNTREKEYFFQLRTKFYLRKDGHYHGITSEGDLLQVLKDRKKEVQRYLRDNKLKYKQNPEQALLAAARYYDTLNP